MNPIKPGQFLLGRKPTANKNVIGWTEEETKAAKETTASANLISVIHPSFPFLITSYDFPFSFFFSFPYRRQSRSHLIIAGSEQDVIIRFRIIFNFLFEIFYYFFLEIIIYMEIFTYFWIILRKI